MVDLIKAKAYSVNSYYYFGLGYYYPDYLSYHKFKTEIF